MNVGGILDALQQGQIIGGRNLSFALDGDSTLVVGKIVKGQVMRHYDGNRYGVEFGGRERVVDSSVPLGTGELIRGRVLAIDERVHLQRLPAQGPASEPVARALNRHLDGARSPAERLLLQLFEQYQARLASRDFRAVGELVAKAARADLMALSALILSKAGARLEPAFVRAIYRFLQLEPARLPRAAPEPVARLATAAAEAAPAGAETPATAALAAALAQLHQRYNDGQRPDPGEASAAPPVIGGEVAASRGKAARDAADEERERALGERLFNAQNDAAVAHRLLHLPLWLGDRLVEVQVAFFAQKRDRGAADTDLGPYRKIVFALDTEHLGKVEVVVRLAQRRARVEFVTADSAATGRLARHSAEVERTLTALGWQIDEQRYATAVDAGGGAVGAVVEHYITQDSFSRLM